jgi:hypothetical protein
VVRASLWCYVSLKVLVPVDAVKSGLISGRPLEPLAAAARAQVVSAELLLQQLVPVDDADAGFHVRFRRIAPPTFAHRLKKTVLLGFGCTWDTSLGMLEPDTVCQDKVRGLLPGDKMMSTTAQWLLAITRPSAQNIRTSSMPVPSALD